jgi:ABC-2 type transport system permease protein
LAPLRTFATNVHAVFPRYFILHIETQLGNPGPDGFSRSLIAYQQDNRAAPAKVINIGDQTNLRSAMAMALADYIAFAYAFVMTDTTVPLKVSFENLGGKQSQSSFDLYVPALLMFSLIMIFFTAATSLIKEVDNGTMSRLMLSNLGTGQFVFAISLNQMLIGISAMALTYISALTVGYTSSGSLITLFVVAAISTLAVVALSVLLSAFMSSIFELWTVGCFPFFLLLLFSDCMFPLPKVDLFSVAGNMLYATDILPTSFTMRALNKVLNHGAGLTDIAFELAAIAILTAGYFVLGSWLFRRRHQCVN